MNINARKFSMDGLLAAGNSDDIIEYLHRHPEEIDSRYGDGKTLLMYAVENEKMDLVNCLINYGCNVNLQDSKGLTALHYSCKNGRSINTINFVIKLTGSGASCRLRTTAGLTPLHFASIYAKDVNIINRLISLSDPNELTKTKDNSLTLAVNWNTNLHISEKLIQYTNDINHRNNEGRTALQIACENDNEKLVQLLLRHGLLRIR